MIYILYAIGAIAFLSGTYLTVVSILSHDEDHDKR